MCPFLSERRPRTRKTERITVRLHTREHEILGEKASAIGVTLGTYLRELGLGPRLRARPGHLDGEAIAQLSRVGNNLRQLERVAAEAGNAQVQADLQSTFAELQVVIDGLLAETSQEAP
jgi:hypothetical protein